MSFIRGIASIFGIQPRPEPTLPVVDISQLTGIANATIGMPRQKRRRRGKRSGRTTDPKFSRIVLWIDRDVIERVRQMAEKEGMSMDEVFESGGEMATDEHAIVASFRSAADPEDHATSGDPIPSWPPDYPAPKGAVAAIPVPEEEAVLA